MSHEAFMSMRRILKPEGTLVINTLGDFEPGRDYFAASLSKTLAQCVPESSHPSCGASQRPLRRLGEDHTSTIIPLQPSTTWSTLLRV